MSMTFAMMTSDPNLLACELLRVRREVRLSDDGGFNAVGVGSYALEDEVLLQRYPAHAAPADPGALAANGSEAVVHHARNLPVGMSLDDNTQPFRFRQWLFAHTGELTGYRSYKQQLWDELPDFLKRTVRGETDSELAFALFLRRLKDSGRIDDPALEPLKAAALLGEIARQLGTLSREHGGGRPASLAMVATNQRVLVAVRVGPQPVFFRQLQGTPICEKCNLPVTSPQAQPLLRAHERRKSVAVATHLVEGTAGWQELSDGQALAVGTEGVAQVLDV